MNVYKWFPYKIYYARIFDLFSDMSDVYCSIKLGLAALDLVKVMNGQLLSLF